MNELILPLPCLDIEHHYGVRGVQLNDLGQINLIVGANNCGKTTVLSYIFHAYRRSSFPLCQAFPLPLEGGPRLAPRSLQEATAIVELLKIVDPAITGLDERLYIRHERLGFAASYQLGAGINRLLQIAVGIARAENGVFLIDDAEIGLHPAIMCEAFAWIVQWAKKHNVQMFLTTHSLDLVDALISATGGWDAPESDDDEDDIPEGDLDLVLFRLEPRDEETRIVRHGRDRLRRLREMGQNVL